jgi:hypothetical protein
MRGDVLPLTKVLQRNNRTFSSPIEGEDGRGRLAFGYIQSKMHGVSNIGPRVVRLIEATYRCV